MFRRSIAWIVARWLARRDLGGIETNGVGELHHGKGKKSTNYITLIHQNDAGCRRCCGSGGGVVERLNLKCNLIKRRAYACAPLKPCKPPSTTTSALSPKPKSPADFAEGAYTVPFDR
jgi:hypothetical protein